MPRFLPLPAFGFVAALALGLGAGGVVGVSSANAAPLTFTYFGNVTAKNNGLNALPAPFNNPGIVIGSPVSFTYTFDSATPDADAGPSSAVFAGVSQIVLSVGPATKTWNFTSPLASLFLYNDLSLPNNTVTDRNGLFGFNAGPGYDQVRFQFDDTSYSAFNSDALPLTQPPASAFNGSFGEVKGTGFLPSYIHFNLTAVPEPASLATLACALPLLRRRRV